ncbi:MAG TPA: aromatic amino acid ammonia-lyase [Gaiellaceae bacterium]|nr:aromatic amino acid ammonia-lyase [Gaiellaceae bacterium]
MTVLLTGSTLTLDDVGRVARDAERVELAPEAVERMLARRAIVERVSSEGTPAYGVTTGVGMRRDASVDAREAAAFNRSAILGHLVGLGPSTSEEVVRAALVCHANGLVAGYQGVRPAVVERYTAALNGSATASVHALGTVGQADLALNADLAYGVLGDLELEAGEALALLNTNAFSTGHAALVVVDARRWLEWADAAATLDFEAFRGHVGALHPEVARVRGSAGVSDTLARLHELLAGSGLWEPDAARFLQDPLTFRCVPQIHGAARDALGFVERQVETALNAHQGNPLVVADEGRLVSVGNFDSQAIATALDLARLALAPVVTACVERALKLLSPRFSSLTEGLVAQEASWQDGLSELGVAGQAIAAEARLLAQPVSIELASTMQESGVEDRMALSSLGARRLSEMLDLAARVVAIELTVAAQAVDLRGVERIGRGAGATHDLVRGRIAFLDHPEQMPLPLEELAGAVRATPAPA